MPTRQRPTYDWRSDTTRLAGQLDKAHSAVDVLSSALDEGDGVWAKNVEKMAHETVCFVADSVKTLKAKQPSTEAVDDLDAKGSSLALAAGGVATVALDVIVNALVALANTEDGDDTDFLVSASLDSEYAYEVGVAIVEAAPQSDEHGLVDLERALRSEGSKALTKKVTQARPRVLAIRERVGAS